MLAREKMMTRISVTEDELRALLKRPLVRGVSGARVMAALTVRSPKPHKYGAKRVSVDGHTFPSLLEARWYTALKWQALGGLITEPLLQVPFSLGKHYGKDRAYVADFVFVDLRTGALTVADAKGAVTTEYERKKQTFEELYGLTITELKSSRKMYREKR